MVRLARCRIIPQGKTPPRQAVPMDGNVMANIRTMVQLNPRLAPAIDLLFNRIVNGQVMVRYGSVDLTDMAARVYGEAITDFCRHAFTESVCYGVIFVAVFDDHAPVCIPMDKLDVWVAIDKFSCVEYFVRESQLSREPVRFLSRCHMLCFEVDPPRLATCSAPMPSNPLAMLMSGGYGLDMVYRPGSKMESLLGAHMMMMLCMSTLSHSMIRNSAPAVALQPNQMPDISKEADLAEPDSAFDMTSRALDTQRMFAEKTIDNAFVTQRHLRQGRQLIRPIGVATTGPGLDLTTRVNSAGMVVSTEEYAHATHDINALIIPENYTMLNLPESTTPATVESTTTAFLESTAAVLNIPLTYLQSDTTKVVAVANVAEAQLAQVAKMHAALLEYVVAIVFLFANDTDIAQMLVDHLGLLTGDIDAVGKELAKHKTLTVSFGTVMRDPEIVLNLFDRGIFSWQATKDMLKMFFVLPDAAFESKDPRQRQEEIELMQIRAKMSTQATAKKRKTPAK